MALNAHIQTDFLLGERKSAPKPDATHFSSATRIDNYFVTTAGHLVRRPGLKGLEELPSIGDKKVKDILPFYDGHVLFLDSGELKYLIGGAIRDIVIKPYVLRIFNDRTLSSCKDYSSLVNIAQDDTLSNLVYPQSEYEINFIQQSGNAVLIYTDISTAPYVLDIVTDDKIQIGPFYLQNKNDVESIYPFLRSMPLKEKDVEFEKAIFDERDKDLQNKIRLAINADADLNVNECFAWLALDKDQETGFEGLADANRMALSDYIGVPLFFNILPSKGETLPAIDGDNFNTANSEDSTAYDTTLLQNLDVNTNISNFSARDNNSKVELIKELLYGRKYCIIPIDFEVDSSLTLTGGEAKYKDIFPQAVVVKTAITSVDVTSEKLSEVLNYEVDLPNVNEVVFNPVEQSTNYRPDRTADLPGNFELRFRNDRFWSEVRFSTRRNDMSIRLGVDFTRTTVSQFNEPDGDNRTVIGSDEGLFLNGVRAQELLSEGSVHRLFWRFEEIPLSRRAEVAEITDSFISARINTREYFDRLSELTRYKDVSVNLLFESDVVTQNEYWSFQDGDVIVNEDRRMSWYLDGNDFESLLSEESEGGTGPTTYTQEQLQAAQEFFGITPTTPASAGFSFLPFRMLQGRNRNSETKIITLTSEESGTRELGFKRPPVNLTPALLTEVAEEDVDLFSPNVLDSDDSKIRDLTGLYVTKDVDLDGDIINLIVSGNSDFTVFLNTIKIFRFTDENNTVIDVNIASSVASSDADGVLKTTLLSDDILYDALVRNENLKNMKLSFVLNDDTLHSFDLGTTIIDIDIAFGVSKRDIPILFDEDREDLQIESAGSFDITLKDNGGLQAAGFRAVATDDGIKWTPFVLIKSTNSLTASDTIILKIATDENYTLTKTDLQRSGTTEYRLLDADLLDTKPARAIEDVTYSLEILSGAANDVEYIFSPAEVSERESKAKARCVIFELGMPSPVVQTQGSSSTRTIGGNDYDKKTNYASRVIEAETEALDIATPINNFISGFKGNNLYRLSKPSEGHSNNIISRLNAQNTNEFRRTLIESGFSLNVLFAQQGIVKDDFNRFFLNANNVLAYGDKGITLFSNVSYTAIQDYLGLGIQKTGALATFSNVYSRELKDRAGKDVVPKFATPTYDAGGIFVGTEQGTYIIANNPGDPKDLSVILASNYNAKISPIVFNNKINYITSQSTIASILSSEERRGIKVEFFGEEQHHLLSEAIQILYNYNFRKYFILQKNGNIVVANDYDNNIAGFSLINFVNVGGKRNITCLKLFESNQELRGLFRVEHENKIVIATFNGENFIDLEEYLDEFSEQFVFDSILTSNAIIYSQNARGSFGNVFLSNLQQISASISEDMESLKIGFSNAANLDMPLFIDYIEKDNEGNRLYPDVQPAYVNLEPAKAWESYVILRQNGKTNGGTIYGFNVLGDSGGTV